MSFTHLHVHTQYSLLDGSSKIKDIIDQAKELGMDSLAITDHGVMYGVIDFYKAAKEAGIKPILGCEVYVAPGSRFDKKPGTNESRYYHLVLLAENEIGYKNLVKIVSRGFTEGYYYKPRVDLEVLEEFHEGIIALSACLAGEISRALVKDEYERAKEAALRYDKIFGHGNFFLELQDHGYSDQKKINPSLVRLSKELDIKLVATNDVHYTRAEDAEAHDILLCIQTGKKVTDADRMRYLGGQFYLKSEDEMRSLFPYAKEAIENTHMIAERCNLEIEFGNTKVPHFETPEGYDSKTYLTKLCQDGLKKRYPDSIDENDEIHKRLDYELSVIESMGYVDYFLIVWDYINYAKTHGIPVGPGRGSAAGSIVSYCMGITELDPIKYNLIFERFLNPERVSMPDIDVDFAPDGRQQVIDYVVEKYGKDCVVQIVTFGTMAARGVIKDVGRALDLSFAETDRIAKMIPMKLGMTLKLALEQNPDFKSEYENNEHTRKLIDTCLKLEGLPRHASTHAAGVLISQLPVEEYVPVSISAEGGKVAQFVMTTLEELGLLKMDFLGLRNLSVIRDTEELIRRKNPDFDIEKIDFNDKEVYSFISTGKTEGIFQLESAGMKSFMKELKPNNIEDMIAGISLYRPGPMDFIPNYIKGKTNPQAVSYDCPQLEPILSPTYGCIVYQEQVMQIVRDLAGYSWGRSDLVRRAMSKKKAYVMEEERKNFIYGNEKDGVAGCVKNGIDEKIAGKIYDEMIDFAKYAFNKSHAACYAIVSYETAFLKCHYPAEFMAALMSSVVDNSAKIAEYILSCRQMKIKVLEPDINKSIYGFSVEDGNIRFGFSAIKALGIPTVEAIVSERDLHGPYTSFHDFIKRTIGKLNKKTVENLIKSGAFDTFKVTRRALAFVYMTIMEDCDRKSKDSMSGQYSLFDMMGDADKKEMEIQIPDVEEYPLEQKLENEKDVMGIYVTGHPLDEYSKTWEKHVSAKSIDFGADEDGQVKVQDGSRQTVGGLITQRNIKSTKKGDIMAFLTIEDLVGTMEIVVFPRDYMRNKEIIDSAKKVFISGQVKVDMDSNAKLIANSFVNFDDLPRTLWLRFDNQAAYFNEKAWIEDLIGQNSGRDKVIVYLKEEEKKLALPVKMNIHITSEILSYLSKKLGDENVVAV